MADSEEQQQEVAAEAPAEESADPAPDGAAAAAAADNEQQPAEDAAAPLPAATEGGEGQQGETEVIPDADGEKANEGNDEKAATETREAAGATEQQETPAQAAPASAPAETAIPKMPPAIYNSLTECDPHIAWSLIKDQVAKWFAGNPGVVLIPFLDEASEYDIIHIFLKQPQSKMTKMSKKPGNYWTIGVLTEVVKGLEAEAQNEITQHEKTETNVKESYDYQIAETKNSVKKTIHFQSSGCERKVASLASIKPNTLSPDMNIAGIRTSHGVYIINEVWYVSSIIIDVKIDDTTNTLNMNGQIPIAFKYKKCLLNVKTGKLSAPADPKAHPNNKMIWKKKTLAVKAATPPPPNQEGDSTVPAAATDGNAEAAAEENTEVTPLTNEDDTAVEPICKATEKDDLEVADVSTNAQGEEQPADVAVVQDTEEAVQGTVEEAAE